MAIQKEIWQQDIIDNLYKNNEFANRCVNADQYVLGGAVVHKAKAGAATTVRKNLTVFPQTATQRNDVDVPYALDTYYALPRHIPKLDQYELSYDKRASVVGEDNRKLIQSAMEGLLINWGSTATNQIMTDGAASAMDLVSGATGERRLFTKSAFKQAAKGFANSDYEGFRLTAALTANHYYQLFESLSDAEKADFGRVADLSKGIIGQYMGIDIIRRSSVLRYRKVGGVYQLVDTQADDYAPDANDCAASLFYAENAVERAKGDVEVFDNPGQALYYGDIYSAFTRLGGRTIRQDGVYSVIEAIEEP